MQGAQIGRIRQRGFTLMEMLITTIMIGVLGSAIAAIFPLFSAMNAQEYTVRQKRVNMEIASAMEAWSASHGTTANQLPAPYTAGNYKSAVLNPAATAAGDPATFALMDYLLRRSIDLPQMTHDGTPSQNVRTYQRVTGLTEQMPLFGVSGPDVQLTYQIGVIYTTPCSFPCSATLPGGSPQLTVANRNSWQAHADDTAPAFASTLSLQRARLAVTVERLNRLSSALINHINTQRVSAAPTDTTNWFPAAGASAGTGMGCAVDWSGLTSTQLNTLALPANEYSQTAWGGPIQYCRDYAPDGSAANTPPHYGALRIRADLSAAGTPNATACTGSNFATCSVLVTF